MRKPAHFMGILNVTPDSFSDGGKCLEVEAAIKHADELIRAGADSLDIGGESTRPGAKPVSCQEELDRVLPVIEALRGRFDTLLSIDTQKYEVAQEAVRLGVRIVNDVSGGKDMRTASLVARENLQVILMHMQGEPQTMQDSPQYARGVVVEVAEYLKWRVGLFEELGVRREQIWVDPGIGFGKTTDQNQMLLKNLSLLHGIGSGVLIGTSRKSFIAKTLGDPKLEMEKRTEGTLVSNIVAWEQGASVFRVHDVGSLRRAFVMWESLQ